MEEADQPVTGWQATCPNCGRRLIFFEERRRLPLPGLDALSGHEVDEDGPVVVVLDEPLGDKPVYCPVCGARLPLASR